jgi:acyl-CoA thioesterase YciA
MKKEEVKPKGELTIQVQAMPKDTNPSGDIFGGWLMSQMDMAGGIFSQKIAKGRVVTVSIDSIVFNLPVFIGDTLFCYVELIKKGRTSITVLIEAYVNRQFEADEQLKVTEGIFKYVKVNEQRVPIPI